jgi:preprotein translocase subunit SecG
MILSYLSMTVLMILGIFMIIIILLQRGRGGGLAGAFGGLGGQSAFGTKAGDVFTKVTIVLAVIWVTLAGLSGLALERHANRRYTPDPGET